MNLLYNMYSCVENIIIYTDKILLDIGTECWNEMAYQLPNVALTLGQRRRRLANFTATLGWLLDWYRVKIAESGQVSNQHWVKVPPLRVSVISLLFKDGLGYIAYKLKGLQ